ncbi:MAG: serine/threonine protein kinase [Deltaproteobacteria bacterium]|nr:serine/threonine protein kinase [Deltaproteobacteria bacterium]
MPSSVEPRPSETGSPSLGTGEQLGRYRLLKKIARGGMAEVFVARSFGAWGFEKTVAIKRILDKYGNDPAFIRMMVDEAKITVLLNHPNVAQIIELAEQDGDYFIVMEFVPGVSLSALSKRVRERSERVGLLEGCFIVTETLQGLHAAHEQRDGTGRPAHIIHRDVSPQNVLLSFDGHVKVIDFGIARARHRLEMTEVGTIKGKLRYLAPEMIDPLRFMKSGDFDHRVDVFAAGIVLWELIANRTLYEGDDEMAVYDAITERDAPRLDGLNLCDRALANIVARALARSPDERYESAEAFADELRAYLYRSDPSFTHRRVAGALTKHFPAEKEELLALERGALSGSNPPARAAPAEKRGSQQQAAAPAAPPRPPAPEPPAPPAQEATSKVRRERARKNVIDVGEARAPGNAATVVAELPRVEGSVAAGEGDGVLTVNTLVSRSGKSRVPERAATFAAGAETVTVNREARASMSARRGESGASPSAPSAGAPQGGVDDATLGPSLPDQTSEGPTGDFSALLAPVGATVSTPDHVSGARPRRLTITDALRRSPWAPWLLAAATGIGIALIAVVVHALSRPATPLLPPRPTKQPIAVVVATDAPFAVVVRAGVEQPAPARFEALPGDAFEVVVRAPGFHEEVRRVVVPPDAIAGFTLDVPLLAPARPLAVRVVPSDATISVDDQAWSPDATYPVGAIVKVQVSAPGFVTVRRELEVKADGPLELSLELRPEDAAIKPAAALPVAERPKSERQKVTRPKVERPKADVTAKLGTIKIKTKPFITEVTIDGRRQADTTPLTVELPAGKHVVVVRHAASGQSKSATLTVKAGAVVEHTFTFEPR